jgi:hypothetical protein
MQLSAERELLKFRVQTDCCLGAFQHCRSMTSVAFCLQKAYG